MAEAMIITTGSAGFELDGSPVRDMDVLEVAEGVLRMRPLPRPMPKTLFDDPALEVGVQVKAGTVWALVMVDDDGERVGLFLSRNVPGEEWDGVHLELPFACKPLARAIDEGWRFRRVPAPVQEASR